MKKEYALKMDDNDQLSYLKKEFLYGDGKDRKRFISAAILWVFNIIH